MNFEVFFSLLKNNWKTNLSNLNFFAVLFESFVNDDCLNELQYKIENYDHSDVKKIIEKRGPSKDLVSFALDNKDEIKFIDILSENLVDINFIQNKLEEENFDFYTRDGDIDCFQTIYDLFVKLLRNILKRIKTVEPPIYKKNYNFFRDLYDKKMTYNDHLFHIEKHLYSFYLLQLVK